MIWLLVRDNSTQFMQWRLNQSCETLVMSNTKNDDENFWKQRSSDNVFHNFKKLWNKVFRRVDYIFECADLFWHIYDDSSAVVNEK